MDAQALLALRLAGSAEANVVVGPVLAKGSGPGCHSSTNEAVAGGATSGVVVVVWPCSLH
jgi:hypothetical protein